MIFQQALWHQMVESILKEGPTPVACGAAADYLEECDLPVLASYVRNNLAEAKPTDGGNFMGRYQFGWWNRQSLEIKLGSELPSELHDVLRALAGDQFGNEKWRRYVWLDTEDAAFEYLYTALLLAPSKVLEERAVASV